jgi:hypothetical protein
VNERCNDTGKQDLFSGLSEKMSVFYRDIKQNWSKEDNIECCNRNERRSMAWWRLGFGN